MSDFMYSLKNSIASAAPNVSVTENGAVGYKTSGKKLLDLNFMLSSMRNMDEGMIWSAFLSAYNEDPILALRWLFFARDVREGCGERRTFRIIFERLCRENDMLSMRLLRLLPFYGRWDDLVEVFCGNVPCNVRDKALELIRVQMINDLDNASNNRPVSLCAKWLPSINSSSRDTKRKGEQLRSAFGMSPRQYRKMLSTVRKKIDVVERRMSANDWSGITYSSVPSRAAMNYRDAFTRHDFDRYNDYLSDVREGKAKINAGVLYPYDIVHAYDCRPDMNPTLEAQWKALGNTVPTDSSTIVVVDGSGSMCQRIGHTNVTCLEVAYSLGIYFAERLSGPYFNQFITFSSHPRYVGFADGLSLRAKIDIMMDYDDCSNTDIEKVFDMLLDTAVRNNLSQEEIPANILIVSDMEFDSATYRGGYGFEGSMGSGEVDKALFDVIRGRWKAAGYDMPRLIFWNVCSRTGTIPVSTNELGVALVSGFSPNIADMVLSGDLNPYKCLVDKLMSDRYDPVSDALKE